MPGIRVAGRHSRDRGAVLGDRDRRRVPTAIRSDSRVLVDDPADRNCLIRELEELDVAHRVAAVGRARSSVGDGIASVQVERDGVVGPGAGIDRGVGIVPAVDRIVVVTAGQGVVTQPAEQGVGAGPSVEAYRCPDRRRGCPSGRCCCHRHRGSRRNCVPVRFSIEM